MLENTKRWSKRFLWIGHILIITFLLVGFRIIIDADHPDDKELYQKLINIRNLTFITGSIFLMMGYAIKSIYTEILDIYRK